MSKDTQLEELGCKLRFLGPVPQQDFVMNPSRLLDVGARMTYKGSLDSSVGHGGTRITPKAYNASKLRGETVNLDGVTECERCWGQGIGAHCGEQKKRESRSGGSLRGCKTQAPRSSAHKAAPLILLGSSPIYPKTHQPAQGSLPETQALRSIGNDKKTSIFAYSTPGRPKSRACHSGHT